MLEAAEDILGYLERHSARGALVAYDLADPAGGIRFRADAVQPIGSVFKVPVLLALAEEAAAGRLDLAERVPLADVAAYRLTGTGVDVSETSRAALAGRGVSLDDGTIALADLAWAMIAVSDNEATDYLVMRLGEPLMAALPATLGLPSLEPPMPVSGMLATWAGPADGPRPRGWTSRCKQSDRAAFRLETFARAAALAADAGERARVTAAVTRELSETRIKALAWTLPRATPEDVAALMARAATLPTAVGETMRRALRWPLDAAPVLGETFADLGYKPGSIEGLLAGAWYGRRHDQASARVVALSLVGLPLADYRELLETAAMQLFERKILADDAFFAVVRARLTSRA